ncbi:MAG: glutathione S-transferase family protein [Gammaproteobacteria bacterium]
MTITFYCGSGSPPAWRVWLALEHKRLPYTLRMLSFSGADLKNEGFTRLNPRGKVPVLTDGGFTLYESVAIVEYLDDRYPDAGDGRLFPEDLQARARTRRLIQEMDHYLAPAVGPMLREVFYKPEAERDAAVIATGREKAATELRSFEGELRGDFLMGLLSAADHALYPLLALTLRADLKDPRTDVRGLIGPKLAEWMGRMEALPYYEKTYPPHWKPV